MLLLAFFVLLFALLAFFFAALLALVLFPEDVSEDFVLELTPLASSVYFSATEVIASPVFVIWSSVLLND